MATDNPRSWAVFKAKPKQTNIRSNGLHIPKTKLTALLTWRRRCSKMPMTAEDRALPPAC